MLALITATDASTLVRTFNWHSPSWDLFIILAWVLVSVIYAFAAGRGRVVNILICSYVAQLLVIKAPFLTSALNKSLTNSFFLPLQQLTAFVVIFLLLFLFLGRYVFRTSADSHKFTAILFGVVFSFFQIGLLINIILGYLPVNVQESFSSLIQILFIRGYADFVWLILPLAFLIVLGKFLSEDDEI